MFPKTKLRTIRILIKPKARISKLRNKSIRSLSAVRGSKTPEGDDRQAEQNFEEREIANWHAPDMIIGEKASVGILRFSLLWRFLWLLLLLQMWSFAALIAVASVAIMVTRRESNQSTVSYSLSTRGIYITAIIFIRTTNFVILA